MRAVMCILSASRTSKCMFLAVQRTTKLRNLGRWILVVQSAYWHCAQASHQPRDAVCRRSQLITHATKTWQYRKQGPVVIIGLLSNGLTFKPAVLQAAGAGSEQGMWIACSWLKLGNEPPELSQQPAWQADCELTDDAAVELAFLGYVVHRSMQMRAQAEATQRLLQSGNSIEVRLSSQRHMSCSHCRPVLLLALLSLSASALVHLGA